MQLLTGGAGFIGVNFADRLLARGETVVVVDNFTRPGAAENLRWLRQRYADVEVVEADVAGEGARLAELVADASAVYHLAAQTAVTRALVDPRADFETNVLGTLNVLDAARAANPDVPIVYASTNKVYGSLGEIGVREAPTRYEFADDRSGIDESQPLRFESPYACSKGAADQYVLDYARSFGLRTVVLRLSCVYGPHQFGGEDQGWLAWFAIAAFGNRPVTIYGSGKQLRDVLHVSDALHALELAAAAAEPGTGKVYNVGGGATSSLSLLEAIELFAEAFGQAVERRFASSRAGDQRVYVSHTGKAARELGWTPRVPLAAGIRDLVDWVCDSESEVRRHLTGW